MKKFIIFVLATTFLLAVSKAYEFLKTWGKYIIAAVLIYRFQGQLITLWSLVLANILSPIGGFISHHPIVTAELVWLTIIIIHYIKAEHTYDRDANHVGTWALGSVMVFLVSGLILGISEGNTCPAKQQTTVSSTICKNNQGQDVLCEENHGRSRKAQESSGQSTRQK